MKIPSCRLMAFARPCALGLPEKRAGSFLATTLVLRAILGHILVGSTIFTGKSMIAYAFNPPHEW